VTEWRDIPGYEGRYQISDDGRIMTFPDATAVAQARFNGFVLTTWSRASACSSSSRQ